MAVITPLSSEIHRLNEIGAIIWKRCEHGATQEELIGELLEQYDVSPEQATQDIKDFLDEATAKGILLLSS